MPEGERCASVRRQGMGVISSICCSCVGWTSLLTALTGLKEISVPMLYATGSSEYKVGMNDRPKAPEKYLQRKMQEHVGMKNELWAEVAHN